jgi:hypothetical protein
MLNSRTPAHPNPRHLHTSGTLQSRSKRLTRQNQSFAKSRPSAIPMVQALQKAVLSNARKSNKNGFL